MIHKLNNSNSRVRSARFNSVRQLCTWTKFHEFESLVVNKCETHNGLVYLSVNCTMK
jgi:hypothetical protein